MIDQLVGGGETHPIGLVLQIQTGHFHVTAVASVVGVGSSTTAVTTRICWTMVVDLLRFVRWLFLVVVLCVVWINDTRNIVAVTCPPKGGTTENLHGVCGIP